MWYTDLHAGKTHTNINLRKKVNGRTQNIAERAALAEQLQSLGFDHEHQIKRHGGAHRYSQHSSSRGKQGVQGCPWPWSQFEVSLGYVRLSKNYQG